MAGSFPTLSFGATAMYPLTLRVSCITRVLKAANSTEQRFAVRPAMATLEVSLVNASATDKASVDSFFDTQKGAFDSSWDITVDGKTYTSARFMDDELSWEESKPTRWTTRLTIRAFYPAVVSPPSTLPSLSTGAVTQLPWSKSRQYETNFEDMESGPRHAVAMRAGGLTNFPTDPQRTWSVKWPAATETEVENLIQFFVGKHGRLGSFSFTDPDTSVTYTGCRFDSDDLEVQYLEPQRCSAAFAVTKL